MSPLEQLCRIFIKKNLEPKGLQGPYGKVRETFGIFGGGVGFGGPMNIIYKGARKCCNKRIHQICNHITFTDMSDSWPIYLLYIWWEIDRILISHYSININSSSIPTNLRCN
jgi:hypothetical protein